MEPIGARQNISQNWAILSIFFLVSNAIFMFLVCLFPTRARDANICLKDCHMLPVFVGCKLDQ